MRPSFLVGALLLVASGAVQAASPRDKQLCLTADMSHLDEKIASCTRLLDAGGLAAADRAMAYANRAGAYVGKGDREHAFADANEAIRIDPKNAVAYVNRAASYQGLADDRAIADSSEAIRLNPKMAMAYANRAGAHLRKGDFDLALADASEAIRLDSSNDIAFNNRAAAYFGKGDNDHAITDYSRAIVLKPKAPEYVGRRAGVFLEKKDFSHAAADYSRAIDLDPKNADFYGDRGLSYLRNDEFDRAIADFTQAASLGPNSKHFYNRALAYFIKDDHDRAIADLDEAIKLDPKDAMNYFYRGRNQAAKNDYKSAIADYDKAIGIDSKNVRFFNARGESYAENGDTDRAIIDYTQAIAFDGKSDVAYGNRANAYLSKGEYERASADYGQAIDLDSKDFSYFWGRARSNFYAGQSGKALADLNQASTLKPKSGYVALWTQIMRQRSGLQDNLSQISSPSDTDWPAPVIRLFQGQIGYDALLAAADDPRPSKKKGRVCEANFYAGELELAKGSKNEAIRLFRLASNNCPRSFDEFGAANAELRALGVTPGPSTVSRIVNSVSGWFGGSKPEQKTAPAVGGSTPPKVSPNGAVASLERDGEWEAFAGMSNDNKKVCYALTRSITNNGGEKSSLMIKTGPPDSALRELSIQSNYTDADSHSVVRVGGTEFNLWSRGNQFWIFEPSLIDAMRQNSELVVRSSTPKDGQRVDRYSLSGFAAALDRAIRECR